MKSKEIDVNKISIEFRVQKSMMIGNIERYYSYVQYMFLEKYMYWLHS